MANRNTLHVKKLDAFKEWLTLDGWEIKQPKGDYEVLRAVKAGRKPLLIRAKSLYVICPFVNKDKNCYSPNCIH